MPNAAKIITILVVFHVGLAVGEDINLNPKSASRATIAAYNRVKDSLPVDTGRDLDFVTRGFIATVEDPVIRTDSGEVVWNSEQLSWVQGEAPHTVNPSLWRHAKLLAKHGLFKVTDGVWQVRNLDPANMTIVKGDTGWVIIDPLYNVETARAAMELVHKHVGRRPVTGVVYSHSHPDHFGGVRGVIGEGEDPVIIAPEHLVEENTSEALLAGNVMSRRLSYQAGAMLEPGPRGIVTVGITQGVPTGAGRVSLIAPTDSIRQTGEKRVIDGVTMEFQMVPESEAPASLSLFLPEHDTLFIGEIVSCSMHNVQTPRGAKARDALAWAGYLTEALRLYGDRADALVTAHCWPRFGNEHVVEHLRLQRDNYKFMHDQTVRMMNEGHTPTEVADRLQPPKAVANEWSNRSYYGSFKHNAKGVYQYYIGWWDGNPVNLDLRTPVERAERYVKVIGGADKIIATARDVIEDGDYRWAAELLNHLVFAEPDNMHARALLADSLEQMGYQEESATRRNYYLSGAAELRGRKATRLLPQAAPDMFAATSISEFLKLVAARLNPERIGDAVLAINLELTDSNKKGSMALENSVLVNQLGTWSSRADVTVKGTKRDLVALFLEKRPLEKLIEGGLEIEGDIDALRHLQGAMDIPPGDFDIVTP